jgi:hypothetical protein
VVSVESIDYRIFGDNTAIVQSCQDSTPMLLPRNCIASSVRRISVTQLRIAGSARVINTLLIPYSLHIVSLFPASRTGNLKYLVFEFGSELESISDSAFAFSSLRSLFFPPTLRFIGWYAYEHGSPSHAFILDVNLP